MTGRMEPKLFCTVDEVVAGFEKHTVPLRVLLLADDHHPADVVQDHIDAIRLHSRHVIQVINPMRLRLGWSISAAFFDVIIVHYSICILYDTFLSKSCSDALQKFDGVKIQIIQDEYRWIDRMTRRMADLGISVVFSSLAPENARRVYHHDHLGGIRVVSCLPGYVPERTKEFQRVPLTERKFDIVYRGRPLPIWLGKCSQEKVDIGLQALRLADRFGLVADCKMTECDRIYGKAWTDFLMSGRATLATEGGATVFDFDESIEKSATEFRKNNPNVKIDEVWKTVVQPHDGNVDHRTITARVFEAIMCGTALILYPGSYRGVLQPWQHYIPLERDGSNDEIVARLLMNQEWLQGLVLRAYDRVARDPSLHFRHYVSAIDTVINEMASSDVNPRVISPKVRIKGRFRFYARPLYAFFDYRFSQASTYFHQMLKYGRLSCRLFRRIYSHWRKV